MNSKYTDLCLRTDTYADFYSHCKAAGLTLDGEIILTSFNHSLVLIDVLYAETGVILQDDEGNDYPEKSALPGYHANLRCIKPVGLEHLAIKPDNILVEWA